MNGGSEGGAAAGPGAAEGVAGGPRHLWGTTGRIERAILGLGDIARVHVYRWGDGSAHFHLWLYPRPLGMLHASKEMLPLWAELMPQAPKEAVADAEERIRKALVAGA